MRTTVNLEPEAYRLARALALRSNTSLGKVLSDALMKQFKPSDGAGFREGIDADGRPTLYFGRVITPEDVASAIDEE